MKTRHASRFTGELQGKAAPRRTGAAILAATLTAALFAATLALADGMPGAPPAEYGPPPAPPSDSAWDNDDDARRDVRLGNVDHMRLGREDDGSVIMEVRPRPKQTPDQQQVGPFYIYPQVGTMPGQQTGQTGQQTGTQTGRPQQGQPGGMGQYNQSAPGGQGSAGSGS